MPCGEHIFVTKSSALQQYILPMGRSGCTLELMSTDSLEREQVCQWFRMLLQSRKLARGASLYREKQVEELPKAELPRGPVIQPDLSPSHGMHMHTPKVLPEHVYYLV